MLTAVGWYGLAAGWFGGHVPAALAAIALVSLTGALHLLFREPLLWCGAVNRDGTFCRNNARGVLMGCNQVRQHKWQKVKMTFVPMAWRQLSGSVFLGLRKTMVAAGAVITAMSGLASVGLFLVAIHLI